MTKAQKHDATTMPTTGLYSYSAWHGLLVKDIEHGIEDYVIFVEDYCGDAQGVYKRKVDYTVTGRAYFTFRNRRIYFDEILRTM